MLRLLLFSSVLLSACDRLPESFPPPAQRGAAENPGGIGHFVAMSDPGADVYLVSGFRPSSEGSWRWAHEHPILRFHLPPLATARFTMDFALPELTFRATGPVTLAVSIDGHRLPPVRYDKAGEQHFAADVPAEFLPPEGGVVTVAIEPDRMAEPNPGEKLSFVLIRAGFAE